MATIRSAYRAAAGAFTAFVVAMQFWLVVGDEPLGEIAGTALRFFSFFTILTNMLAAAALLVPLLAPRSRAGRFFAQPAVRTAIAGYIVMVGVVYHLMLRGVSGHTGWALTFELMLHYVTPPLYLLDWLLFVPKGEVGWSVGLEALPFPLVYIGWTLAHGAASGWYPYPFVDVVELGYAGALANVLGLILAFLVLELVLVGIGRLLDRAARATTPAR